MMPKKSSSGVTKPFPLGKNLSPIKEEKVETSENSMSKMKNSLMEVFLNAQPKQVIIMNIVNLFSFCDLM